VILFRLMKKTAISSNLFTPKQKLAFIFVLCRSLVNRIFRDQKAVLIRDFRLPIFQILGRCDFISFDEKNCYIIQFIYAQTKTHVYLRFVWFVSESYFQGPKSNFILRFPYSNIPNS
jgi:hypothetical protein